MSLTRSERLQLVNQFLILENVDPSNSDIYQKKREAIEYGFTAEYDQIMDFLYDELPEEECDFVLDVLSMYRDLTFSYKNLTDSDKAHVDYSKIAFPGFDGNNEGRLYSYVDYVLNTKNLYQEIPEHPDMNLNSHTPMRESYLNMIAAWENVKRDRKGLLNYRQLNDVLKQ